jgi:hypothetical protein
MGGGDGSFQHDHVQQKTISSLNEEASYRTREPQMFIPSMITINIGGGGGAAGAEPPHHGGHSGTIRTKYIEAQSTFKTDEEALLDLDENQDHVQRTETAYSGVDEMIKQEIARMDTISEH